MSCAPALMTACSMTSFRFIGDGMNRVGAYGRLLRFWRDCRGASLVEMTILTPLLVSLGYGVGEFGRILHHHHVINKSMRDASRLLARVPVSCPAGSATGSITNASDATLARNLAVTGATGGGTQKIGYWSTGDVAIAVNCFDNSAGTYRGAAGIPLITVSTSVAYSDIGLMTALGLSAPTLNVSHQQVHIGE